MSVYRVVDVIGTSTQSWEDAATTAVNTARKSIRDLRVAEVVEQDLSIGDGGEITYRTKIRLMREQVAGPATRCVLARRMTPSLLTL